MLAELKNTCVGTIISDEAVAAVDWNEDSIYIYDAEKEFFRKTEIPEYENDLGRAAWKEYINENEEGFTYYEYYVWKNKKYKRFNSIGLY